MTDLQASIGIHQLKRLPEFTRRRRQIDRQYSEAFADLEELVLPGDLPERRHVHHLYTLRIIAGTSRLDRDAFIRTLRNAGLGTSVHFIPLHQHPFYRIKYGDSAASFPVADALFPQMVSLRLYPAMSDRDVLDVIAATREAILRSRGRVSTPVV